MAHLELELLNDYAPSEGEYTYDTFLTFYQEGVAGTAPWLVTSLTVMASPMSDEMVTPRIDVSVLLGVNALDFGCDGVEVTLFNESAGQLQVTLKSVKGMQLALSSGRPKALQTFLKGCGINIMGMTMAWRQIPNPRTGTFERLGPLYEADARRRQDVWIGIVALDLQVTDDDVICAADAAVRRLVAFDLQVLPPKVDAVVQQQDARRDAARASEDATRAALTARAEAAQAAQEDAAAAAARAQAAQVEADELANAARVFEDELQRAQAFARRLAIIGLLLWVLMPTWAEAVLIMWNHCKLFNGRVARLPNPPPHNSANIVIILRGDMLDSKQMKSFGNSSNFRCPGATRVLRAAMIETGDFGALVPVPVANIPGPMRVTGVQKYSLAVPMTRPLIYDREARAAWDAPARAAGRVQPALAVRVGNPADEQSRRARPGPPVVADVQPAEEEEDPGAFGEMFE